MTKCALSSYSVRNVTKEDQMMNLLAVQSNKAWTEKSHVTF